MRQNTLGMTSNSSVTNAKMSLNRGFMQSLAQNKDVSINHKGSSREFNLISILLFNYITCANISICNLTTATFSPLSYVIRLTKSFSPFPCHLTPDIILVFLPVRHLNTNNFLVLYIVVFLITFSSPYLLIRPLTNSRLSSKLI